jgi:hypothetical protein
MGIDPRHPDIVLAKARGLIVEPQVAVPLGAVPVPGREVRTTYTEREFQRDVLALAKANGWRRAHFAPARVTRRGVEKYETPVRGDGRGFPDLILLRDGVMLVAELKTDTGRTTKEQEAWLRAFREAGIAASVWRPRDMNLITKALT